MIRSSRMAAGLRKSIGLPMLSCLLPLSGCSGKPLFAGNGSQFRAAPAPSPEEKEFDEGSNRPPTIRTRYAASRILASQGRDVECELALSAIISESPTFIPAYCLKAQVQIHQRRIDPAIETLQAGLKLSPRDAVLFNNLGMCRMMKGEFERALAAYTESVAIEPDNARYRANMAAMLGILGRYEEAKSVYEQILPPDHAHHNLAVLLEARDVLLAGTDFNRVSGKTLGEIGGFHSGTPAAGNQKSPTSQPSSR